MPKTCQRLPAWILLSGDVRLGQPDGAGAGRGDALPVIESPKKLDYVHFSTKTEATRLVLDRIS
jgi:hypothetical protein